LRLYAGGGEGVNEGTRAQPAGSPAVTAMH